MSSVKYLPKGLVNNNIKGVIYHSECPNCGKEPRIDRIDFNQGYPIIQCEACPNTYLLIEKEGKTKTIQYNPLIENIATMSLVINNKLDNLLLREERIELVPLKTYTIEDTGYIGRDRIRYHEDETHYVPKPEAQTITQVLENLELEEHAVTRKYFRYFWKMKSIKVKIEKLNTPIGMYESITSLSISGNLRGGDAPEYEFFIPETITNLTNLKQLRIDDLIIKDSDNLTGLIHLDSLGLTDANLTNTRFLQRMTNLNYLDLAGNKLDSAQGIGHLTNLESLSLSVNNIKEVRKEDKLWQLKKVKSFSIGRNQLQELRWFPPAKSIRVFGNPCHPGID